MIRHLLAGAILLYATCELAACGGELRADVDADAPFDLDAHWGECCFGFHGPEPYCPGDAATPGQADGAYGYNWVRCQPWQYCGVPRASCNNDPSCNNLFYPPYECCGDSRLHFVPDAAPGWWQPGMDLKCAPVALDDGGGIPPPPADL